MCFDFREANKCVDVLAKMGCELSSQMEIYIVAPASLGQVLIADIIGVSTPH